MFAHYMGINIKLIDLNQPNKGDLKLKLEHE